MSDNIYKPYSGRTYHYGTIPVTIDSTRGVPYVQYALLRQGEAILQPGAAGADIPAEWSVETTGPIFSVSFVITSGTLSDITPDDFAEMLRPTLSAAPLASENITKTHELVWDSDDPGVSAWPTGIADIDKKIDLDQNHQYCVTTKPLPSSDLDDLQSGVVHFSLEPTGSTTFDNTELGILAVNYKLKKNRVVV